MTVRIASHFSSLILLGGVLGLVSSANLIQAKEPVDYVDLKIGTATKTKRWMLFPGATTPFGLVALSPDDLDRTGWSKGGFDPHLGNIAGFSHIHAWTMAGLLTMPTVGGTESEARRHGGS